MSPEDKMKIQENRNKTFLEKYGTEKPNQSKEYREKMSKLFKTIDWGKRSNKNKNEILIPKYSKICENDNLTLLEFRNRFDCTVKCNICDNIFDVHVLGYLTDYSTHNLCRVCHPIDNVSTNSLISIEFEKILIENNVNYIKNSRSIIKPQELDFYIPELNLAFEINGNYWHSEVLKDKNYHLSKSKLCEEQGIKLIHIFEDEITLKYDVVKSRVENLLNKSKNRIYARKCTIKEIDYITKHDFLEKNHLEGDSVSKFNLGLYYEDVLVSVATFGKRKISKTEQFELIRFANLLNYNIVGGFSKLLKHFIKKYNPDELITYADARWSGLNYSNTVYFKNNFEFVSVSQPNYFYLAKNDFINRLNRYNFMKHKLVKMGYDPSKTESQIMRENGYTKIWDCGTLKFKYKKES
jgi:very-short-patch-repair endonuclease